MSITTTRIVDTMRERNINSNQLAIKSGLSPASISRYISGHMEPKPKAVDAIAKVLGVSSSWLLGLDEEKFDFKNSFDLLNDQNKTSLISYLNFLLDQQEGGKKHGNA